MTITYAGVMLALALQAPARRTTLMSKMTLGEAVEASTTPPENLPSFCCGGDGITILREVVLLAVARRRC